jgi:hypothetical protein
MKWMMKYEIKQQTMAHDLIAHGPKPIPNPKVSFIVIKIRFFVFLNDFFL